MTHLEATVNYMKKHKGITSYIAFTKLHNTRLSSTIKLLRDKGYDIETVMVHYKDTNGDHKRYGIYYLIGEPNEKN